MTRRRSLSPEQVSKFLAIAGMQLLEHVADSLVDGTPLVMITATPTGPIVAGVFPGEDHEGDDHRMLALVRDVADRLAGSLRDAEAGS